MENQRHLDRRSVLRGAGIALAAGVAGCTSSSDGDGDGGDGDDGMDDGDGMEDDGMSENESMDDGSMDDSSMDDGDDMDGSDDSMSETATVRWEFANLPELAEGVYEGWAIVGDEKLSTGRFTAGEDATGQVEAAPGDIDKAVVTIEPEPDDDPTPSGVVILAGGVSDGSADLSFPVDFSDAAGSYILATPTNGGDSAETAGIWFLDPSGPAPSLDLPELPGGWAYEGWGVTQGTPLTTGRFTDVATADDFDGYSGEMDAPPFPGEDFLQNAPSGVDFPADFADGNSRVVVSVEPDIDGMDPTGAAPFAIKPLVGSVPERADDHTPYDLQHNVGNSPSGSATIQ